MSKVDVEQSSASEAAALEASSSKTERKHALWARTKAVMAENIDADDSGWPLGFFCLATGWTGAIGYTAARTWVGFQTGNSIQLSIALARTFSGRYAPTSGLGLADGMALASLLSFLAGAGFLQVATRLDIINTRGWHILGTLLCALLTFIAAMLQVDPHKHGQRDYADGNDLGWTGARGMATIGLLGASMGLQGAIAKRLNTNFATSVVLTSVWIDLVSNPNLFHLKRVRSRDQRVYAIALLFIGGFAARGILGGIASAATLGIGAGLRAVGAFAWLRVRAKSVH